MRQIDEKKFECTDTVGSGCQLFCSLRTFDLCICIITLSKIINTFSVFFYLNQKQKKTFNMCSSRAIYLRKLIFSCFISFQTAKITPIWSKKDMINNVVSSVDFTYMKIWREDFHWNNLVFFFLWVSPYDFSVVQCTLRIKLSCNIEKCIYLSFHFNSLSCVSLLFSSGWIIYCLC